MGFLNHNCQRNKCMIVDKFFSVPEQHPFLSRKYKKSIAALPICLPMFLHPGQIAQPFDFGLTIPFLALVHTELQVSVPYPQIKLFFHPVYSLRRYAQYICHCISFIRKGGRFSSIRSLPELFLITSCPV